MDADTRVRYLVVLRSADGWSGKRVCRALGCSPATVSRTLDRWEAYGQAGLVDRREDNGQTKADELYVSAVKWILAGTPQDFLHRRPTWTRALLIETAARCMGVTVSKTTMGRVLAALKARRGRAKPPGPCPWSKARKSRRMALGGWRWSGAWPTLCRLTRRACGRTRRTSTSTPASAPTGRWAASSGR
jgi:transposase